MTKKNENEEIAALCSDYLMDTYAKTATVVRGKGCRVWDARNSVYLDFTAGISVHNVGHAHPKVVEAIRAQAETLRAMSYTSVSVGPRDRSSASVAGRSPCRVPTTSPGAGVRRS